MSTESINDLSAADQNETTDKVERSPWLQGVVQKYTDPKALDAFHKGIKFLKLIPGIRTETIEMLEQLQARREYFLSHPVVDLDIPDETKLESYEVVSLRKLQKSIKGLKQQRETIIEENERLSEAADSSQLKQQLEKTDLHLQECEFVERQRDMHREFHYIRCTDPQLGGYLHAFAHTMSSFKTSSFATATGMHKLDTSSLLGHAADLFSLLPFGIEFIGYLIRGIAEQEKASTLMKLNGNFSKYASTYKASEDITVAVALELVKSLGDRIKSLEPASQSRFDVVIGLLKKLTGQDIKQYYFDTPEQILGHLFASKIIQEMSKDHEHTAIPVEPLKTLETRITKWVLGEDSLEHGAASLEYIDSILGQSDGGCHCVVS